MVGKAFVGNLYGGGGVAEHGVVVGLEQWGDGHGDGAVGGADQPGDRGVVPDGVEDGVGGGHHVGAGVHQVGVQGDLAQAAADLGVVVEVGWRIRTASAQPIFLYH